MSAFAAPTARMSVTEFLNWDSGDQLVWQLVDGEPQAMAPANADHGRLQAELARLIGNHLRETALPCDIYVNPGVIPKTMSAINMRIPDLAVSCTPSVLGQAVPYNPVVIIEILSPSNRAETWANVWTYTSVPSVKDILILRTDIMIGDLVSRLPDGSWPDQPSRLDSDIILDSIGFRVALQDVYARTPFAPSR